MTRTARFSSSAVRGRGLLSLLILAFALVFVARAHAAALTFPALSGRVVDDAHVLPAATVTSLEDKLKGLQDQNSRQLVVVTLPSLQGDDIADYGYQLGRKWGIGQKGTNNGALFIIVPSEHKVRIEVGYGLEGGAHRRPDQRHPADPGVARL